ncbi:MAG: Imm21 family immunity protein [Akkermansiaceae bacterium]|jgi:hypothetical protein
MDLKAATSFGGPFVILPRSLTSAWAQEIGDSPTPDEGLYEQVCHVGSLSFMRAIPFQGIEVISIAEQPDDIFWVPQPSGGLIIQWIAADSLEGLIVFSRQAADRRIHWQETLEFEIVESEIRIMDSCGFETDDQPKIDVTLAPGRYQINAAYEEDDDNMAMIFKISLVSQAST